MKNIDLITIGRTSVDLYGDQVGEQLKNMVSFSKYVGGSPTNTAIGAAKLGLDVGHITKVGDEALGHFIIESLEEYGVNTDGLIKDPDRLTSTTVLGINGREKNTLVYFRENCADANLEPEDIDPEYIATAKAILISGTIFYTPSCRETCRKILSCAQEHGCKIILDVDHRPVFIGTEEENQEIAALTRSILDKLDLVVGTKEELSWLTGEDDKSKILHKIRKHTPATIVLKVGADGCMVYPDAIPDNIENGVKGPKFKVVVCNVFGAGDAFMGGFLRGWLTDQPLETCITWGNACGAIVVSRHGCSPESPSWEELQFFIKKEFDYFNENDKTKLEHIHWATATRPQTPRELKCLAMDHQWQFEKLMNETGKRFEDVVKLKQNIFYGFKKAVVGHENMAVLMDDTYCEDLILEACESEIQIIRRTEKHREAAAPLEFLTNPSIASVMNSWPHDHIAKMLVYFHKTDSDAFKVHQLDRARQLYWASRSSGHQIILEPIPTLGKSIEADTTSYIMEEIYKTGIKPDWWKIDPPQNKETWGNIIHTMEKYDSFCKGFLLLGKENSLEDMLKFLEQSREKYAQFAGFAIGRPVFWEVAKGWMHGKKSDDDVINEVAHNITLLLGAWK